MQISASKPKCAKKDRLSITNLGWGLRLIIELFRILIGTRRGGFSEVCRLHYQNSSSHKKPFRPGANPRQNETKDFDFPDVNHVAIAGTLINDPPLRRTKRGIPVTNFVIATAPEALGETPESTEREKCHVSVVVWSQQAVECNKHLHKGSSVLIMGEIQSMPNFSPDSGYFPVQINAQWIQYLEKGAMVDLNPPHEGEAPEPFTPAGGQSPMS